MPRAIRTRWRPWPQARTRAQCAGSPAIRPAPRARSAERATAAFRDGWFLTGDLGRRDADGYFWFIARKKDIIRKRGENISGAELDRVIGAHPDVLEAASIPVPAELGEDEILAVVVRRPGATLDANAIADWCRNRLAPIKVPRFVVFADSLPHTPTHRVAKFRLREDATLRERAVDLGDTWWESSGVGGHGRCMQTCSRRRWRTMHGEGVGHRADPQSAI
jgi:acyl-CoA synthetase (AMP-forming)/AMP-acid ligase II